MGSYLGLDCGGTKTTSVVLNEQGIEVSRGYGGSCNIAACGDDVVEESIRSAISSTGYGQTYDGICAGVAGYTARGRRLWFLDLLIRLTGTEIVRIEPDFTTAYWGATNGEPGIVISAGTGAVAYGRDASGNTAREDGLGCMLGDDGSGFDIGKQALRYTLALDERALATDQLACRLMNHIGASDKDDAIDWTYRSFEPARVAELAQLVGEMADEGDDVARMFIRQSARHLAISMHFVATRLKLPNPIPVGLLGGLWRATPLVKLDFIAAYTGLSPEATIEIKEPDHDPAFGAASLARHSAQIKAQE